MRLIRDTLAVLLMLALILACSVVLPDHYGVTMP